MSCVPFNYDSISEFYLFRCSCSFPPSCLQSVQTALTPVLFHLSLDFTKPFLLVLPHSRPSSCSPSPALSTESLSSSSDYSSSQLLHYSGNQQPTFSKSVSEPSICTPSDPTSSHSSPEDIPHPSQSLYPAPVSSNATSAPATPQTGRSLGTKGNGVHPGTPSPLASSALQSHNKVGPPPNKPVQSIIHRTLCSCVHFSSF